MKLYKLSVTPNTGFTVNEANIYLLRNILLGQLQIVINSGTFQLKAWTTLGNINRGISNILQTISFNAGQVAINGIMSITNTTIKVYNILDNQSSAMGVFSQIAF